MSLRAKARLCLCLCLFLPLCLLAASSIQFTDITKAAGITFTHFNGAFGKKFLPETLGPGVAFIDYDGDGWQDLFFTNGKEWPGQPSERSS